MISFRPEGSLLLARDNNGPEFTVSQESADWYAVHFWTHRLEDQADSLRKAMAAAGYVPWSSDRRRAAA